MKVRDLMTADVRACRPETTVADAAIEMWNHDCGVLPVVGEQGRVTGVITDRDICMAVATKDRTADRIPVHEVTLGAVYGCAPDDDVNNALEAMKRHQVRRLPVLDAEGRLKGILSMNDILLKGDRPRDGVSTDAMVAVLKGIGEHRHLQAEPHPA